MPENNPNEKMSPVQCEQGSYHIRLLQYLDLCVVPAIIQAGDDYQKQIEVCGDIYRKVIFKV